MIRTFKTEIRLTKYQKEYFEKAIGTRRWTWNWAVAKFDELVKAGEKEPNGWSLQTLFNNTTALDPEYAWLEEVNTMVRQEAFADFSAAITAWHRAQRCNRKKNTYDPEKGKPTFNKKGLCPDSFRYASKLPLRVMSNHVIRMPFVQGKGNKAFMIKTFETLEFLKGKSIRTTTFSREAGRYYMAIQYEQNPRTETTTGVVGVDLGIKHIATCYDGSSSFVFDVPPTLDAAEKKTERINQKFSKTKKIKDSRRRAKLRLQLQKAYKHEANIKKDYREKFTTFLTRNYKLIKIDDFNFEGAKNLDCNRSLYRVTPYALKLALESKAKERGCSVFYVPIGTPTTKTCSCCGEKQTITLSERIYSCQHCGFELDRDQNSAINIYKYIVE